VLLLLFSLHQMSIVTNVGRKVVCCPYLSPRVEDMAPKRGRNKTVKEHKYIGLRIRKRQRRRRKKKSNALFTICKATV
jgi:hypothetical protein